MSERSLDNYITVKERKHQFYINNPDGRIVVDLLNNTDDGCLFRASCFKTIEDQTKGMPLATGYAQEFKGVGGFANKTSWLENCEESAVGRCLDNAGLSVSKTCSREEIEAANRNKKALAEQQAIKVKYAQYLKENFEGLAYSEQVEEAKKMTIKNMSKILKEAK